MAAAKGRIRQPSQAIAKAFLPPDPPKPTYTLPYRYVPRSYQRRLFEAFDGGCKRLLTVWHRRSGKDTSWLNLTIRETYRRPGTYIHLFPELKRGRKILWEGKNREGQSFLDHIPAPLIKRKREDEMLIELRASGQGASSIWRIEGVENLNSIVGMNPVGVVFSEYSQMRAQAWDLIRPILLENGGWAGFNFTPRGRNHAYDLYQMALTNPEWYCSLLSVSDTRRDAPGEDGLPVITPAMIESERLQGMREELLQQEYFCDFSAGSALQFIPGEYVQAALAREVIGYDWAPKVCGVDVGRNRDRSVITLRQGGRLLERIILHPHEMALNPTETICGWLAKLINLHAPSAVFVDGVGIGAGVVDRMRSLGYSVISVLGNSKSPDEAYYNLRAYMWGQLREWLRTAGKLERGRDDVLGAECQWPQYRWKGDREWLTPKDELEGDSDDDLDYVSPDEADSLALTFAAPVTMQAKTRRPASERMVASMEYNPLTFGREDTASYDPRRW